MFIPNRASPSQQHRQDIKKSSLFGTVAKTALSFIGYGVALKVTKGINFRANMGIGKLIAKLSDPKTGASKAISRTLKQSIKSRDITKEQGTYLARRLGQFRRTTRKAIQRIPRSAVNAAEPLIKEGKYNRSVYKVIDKTQRQLAAGNLTSVAATKKGAVKDIRFTSIIQQTERFKKSAFGKFIVKGQKHASIAHKNPNIGTFSLLRGTSKLSSKDAMSTVIGRMYNYGSYMASIAAIDYAAFNITSPGSSRKWYDPRKIGEWALFSTASDLAFRRVGSLVGMAGRGTKKLTQAAVGDSNKFLHKVLGKVQGLSNSPTAKAIGGTFDKMEDYNRADSAGGQFIKNIKAWSSHFTKLKTQIKRESRNLTKADDFIDENLSNLKNIDQGLKDQSMSDFIKKTSIGAMEKANERNNPNAWVKTINKLFDTKLKSSKRTIPDTDKIAYRGAGFVELEGTSYNIQNALPGKIAKRAFNFVHDNLSIGIGKSARFKPLSIFGLKPLAAASENKFALYTKNDTGLIDIGPGYSQKDIKERLYRFKQDRAQKLLEFDSNLKEAPDHELVNMLDEKMKQFKAGTLAKRGVPKDRQLYETISKISKETQDLEMADDFMTTYLRRHGEIARADKASVPKNAYEAMLSKGTMKLDMDDEFVLNVGSNMYYGMRDGGKWKTFRLGYDSKKGTYHQMLHIAGGAAEGLKNISTMMKAFGRSPSVDTDGSMGRAFGGMSTPKTHQVIGENAGPVRRLIAKGQEALEFGNKAERSIFEIAEDMFTKWMHPKQLRSIQYMIDSNPKTYLDNIKGSFGEMRTFLSRMQTISKIMDVAITNKVISKSSFINEIAKHSKRFSEGANNQFKSVFKLFKEAEMFITDAQVKKIGTKELGDQVKNNARRLIGEFDNVVRGTNKEFEQGITSALTLNEKEFLTKIVRHRDPMTFLREASTGSGGRVSNKEMYNNLTFRTYFNAMNGSQQQDLISNLQSLPSISRMGKDIEMLNMSKMINTYNNIDIDQLSKMGERTYNLLGERTVGEISKNKKAITNLVTELEPFYAPSNLHDNLTYPNPNYQPLNVVLSLNKDDSGHQIYGLGEQLVGQTKDMFGNATGTVQTVTSMQVSQALNAINNTGNIMGIGFNQDAVSSVGEFGKRVLFKRIAPALGLAAAYNASDAFFDESGIFEGTQLGEGLSPMFANVIGQTRLAVAGVNDAIGVTATAKYLEDVMPGFVTSPFSNTVRGFGGPLAGMGLGFKTGGPTGALIGGSIGAAFSIMSAGGPFGMIGKFDISKSRAELIEEYSGRRETPVYKGAGWLFGVGPVKGLKVERFEPSWFHQMTSQYKHTDVLYGSKIERLLSPLDMNHYFEKHKVTRPYPVTEMTMSKTPLLGNIIGFGGGLANEEQLKYAAMENAIAGGNLNMSGTIGVPEGINQDPHITAGTPNIGNLAANTYGGGAGPNVGFSGGKTFGQPAVLPGSFAGRSQAAFAQLTDFAGLRGFISQTAIESQTDGLMPYEDIPKLESASYMTSPFRAYWDAELGDMFGSNELIRRFIPKHGQYVNEVNPIRNQMPMWLANSNELSDLGKGDPYTAIKKGEMRLPGAGYDALHAVNYSFPLETHYLGRSIEEQTAMLTGNYIPDSEDEEYDRYLKPSIVKAVTDQLSMSNMPVEPGRHVFDVNSNLSGKLDLIVNNKGSNIHVVSSDTFNQIGNAPLPHHAAEANANLLLGKMPYGSVIYYNAETGATKTTDVVANPNAYMRDMNSLSSAQSTAKHAFKEMGPSLGINLGNAYSRLERLSILSDVSPYSTEYQSTLKQVRAQKRAGQLSQWEDVRFNNIQTQRETKFDRYDFNEYKFNRGTAVTDRESEYQSYIKDNYNFAERQIGGMWEKFSHLYSPVHTKLLNHQSSIEAYERRELYGKPIRDWGDPYGAFIRPFATSALSKDTFGSGALAFGTAGMVFGGPVGMAGGAMLGSAYGTINPGAFQIPGWRQRERELTGQLDNIRFQKSQQLYETTGSADAKLEMEKTMTYQFNNSTNLKALYGSMPKHERGFIRKFAEAGTEEERKRIMEILPEYSKPVVQAAWSNDKTSFFQEGAEIMESYDQPEQNWKGWNLNIDTDDIAVKMFDKAGLDAHDVSLGWHSQLRKMRYTPGIPDGFSDSMPARQMIAGDIRNIVQSIVPDAQVTVAQTGSPGITVTVV